MGCPLPAVLYDRPFPKEPHNDSNAVPCLINILGRRIQTVLEPCPSRTHISAFRIEASHIVARKRWACLELRSLGVCIVLDSPTLLLAFNLGWHSAGKTLVLRDPGHELLWCSRRNSRLAFDSKVACVSWQVSVSCSSFCI